MNLKSRLSALLVLLVFPLHVSAVISHEKKDEVQKKLDEAVAAAAAQYRSYRYTPIRSEEDIAKAEEQLEKIEYEKRTV